VPVKADEIQEQTIEEGGLHLMELHLPSTGYGILIAIGVVFLIYILVHWGCKRYAAAKTQRQAQRQFPSLPPLPPPQPTYGQHSIYAPLPLRYETENPYQEVQDRMNTLRLPPQQQKYTKEQFEEDEKIRAKIKSDRLKAEHHKLVSEF